MRFSTAAAALFSAVASVKAANYSVIVGFNNTLVFNPNNLTGVVNGDSVSFQFASKNHSVVQSTFAAPCTAAGVSSGFQNVSDPNGQTFPTWTLTVENATAPLWFFCSQVLPTTTHCQSGMVFAINPTAEKSFAAFQQAAIATNATSPTGQNPSGSIVSGTAGATDAALSVSAAPSATAAGSSAAPASSSAVAAANRGKEKEMWIPYPLISLVTRLPQTLQGQCPVTFHCRNFETLSLEFSAESDAADVFDSVKELTVAPSVYHLYAFFYSPNPPFPTQNGWSIYSPREEFGRMGVGTRTKAWRFTDINKDYSFCPTYPAKLLVPTKISDTTLQYAGKYRSKCRIPVLCYLHWSSYATITRSSQPMVGITQNRSIQDEKLIETMFQSHFSPESRVSNAVVYGATTTNLVIDARPTTNAMANTAKGAGTENMDHYKEAKKVYLGIDHIHTMRESLGKVVDALREADALLASINNDLSGQISGVSVLDRGALRRSGWLRHISLILEGTILITRNVHVNSSHVLIHCSDGWDRTSQLSSLSQLCLDPFYRTIKGFEILIEKEWLSYGHKFLDRCGHLSSDKFFVSNTETNGNSGGADAAQAFLASMQNRFASQNHVKETSPVFHQFLETVRQIQRQFPQRFEFNERFLHQLYYHLYSCQFGTFLFNSERERRLGDGNGPPPCDRTVSVWDFFNSPSEMEQNLNELYDSSLDDPVSRIPGADMGVLFPNPKDVRFWHELYGRTDEEMNGRHIPVIVRPEVVGPVETVEDDPVNRIATPSNIPLPPSPSKTPLPPPTQTLPRNVANSLLESNDSSPSTPELASLNLGSPSVVESFRPFLSTSSNFSMKPTSSPTSDSSSRPLTKAQEFFAGGGVKSVWGKLSSNASAAFSVVQGAYDGVARDLSTRPGPASPLPSRTEELSARSHLTSWGEEAHTVSVFSPSTLSSSSPPGVRNPWATVNSSKPSASSLFSPYDNPWNSAQAQDLGSEDEPKPPSPLPIDPTVSDPSLRAPANSIARSNSSSSRLAGNFTGIGSDGDSELSTPSQDLSSASTDPLGVGLA
ncbi:phosphatases II [Lentinula edodes]|uniref:Phosphatases II n=1 Tax=Lentinula edodes TaxID=5353 RepID=A0A1Q3ER12_LENED|nr:phosphatases II [Lentinula edodes]